MRTDFAVQAQGCMNTNANTFSDWKTNQEKG